MRTVRLPVRAAGFSLVELLVSVVIGMLALLFALNMVGGAERTRQSALGGSDEMQNGMVALFTLGNDAADAGFGLNDPLIAGCNTLFSDTKGYALAPATRGTTTVHPLAPVVIESNGADPDRISFYSGSAVAGTPTVRLLSDYSSGTSLSIDRLPWGFNQYDVLVVAPEQPGGDCAVAQRSDSDAAAQALQIRKTVATRFNSGSLGGATFKAYAARIFDLGPADSLAFRSWSVDGGYLKLQATGQGGTSAAAATVAEGIVSIKAEYGFDTRSGAAFQPSTGMQVNQWSATVVDADHSGTVGDAGDYQRIAAVRLAIVARSKAVERAAAGATCSATTAKPTVFAGEAPKGVTAVPIDVNVAVAGDPVDWKCYRYRVFETVVNLRNAGWRPEA